MGAPSLVMTGLLLLSLVAPSSFAVGGDLQFELCEYCETAVDLLILPRAVVYVNKHENMSCFANRQRLLAALCILICWMTPLKVLSTRLLRLA